MLQEKYINPFTDFGFKKLFGSEDNKDLLIDFLNHLLDGKEKIKELSFKNTEQLGNAIIDRRAIFDLYCENENGEKFIIELQKSKQQFFKERSLYYATFPIQQQAAKGEWDFQLKAVYLIGILDFVFDEDKESLDYCHEVKLLNTKTHKLFYDKLSFIYMEMPKFNKSEQELVTTFDKWMYALKFLPYLQDRPKILKEKIFKKLFNIAELSNLNHSEHKSYEDSLKYYRDLKNVVDTARYEGEEKGIQKGVKKGLIKGLKKGKEEGLKKGREEGLQKGREEGLQKGREEGLKKGREEGRIKIVKTAQNLLKLGLSADKISESTGLSLDEIEKL